MTEGLGAKSYPVDGNDYVVRPDKSLGETMAYTWLLQLKEDSIVPGAPQQVVSDWQTVRKWLGIEASIEPRHFEEFAGGWATFIAEEDATGTGLSDTIAFLRKEVGQSSVQINADVRAMYRRLLRSSDAVESKTEDAAASDTAMRAELRQMEKLFDQAARQGSSRGSARGFVGGALISLAFLAYPAWLGANGRPLGHVAIFVVILATALFFFGPKSSEVLHQPSRPLLGVFSLVLAALITAIGYGVGFAIFR